MVKGLGMNAQSVYYFPSGFAKYFPNLAGIELVNGNLKVIRKQNLDPFKYLQAIVMHGNRLESLAIQMQFKCKTVANQIAAANAAQNAEIAKVAADIKALQGIFNQFASTNNTEYCQAHMQVLINCVATAPIWLQYLLGVQV